MNSGQSYGIVFVIFVLVGSGCVSPFHHGRRHVGAGVADRAGLEFDNVCCEAGYDASRWGGLEDGLSEDEAVAIGLWNSPAYQELLADLEITKADIIEASQLQNPQVNTMFPVGPKQWEFALLVPLDALRLRPLRLRAANLESHRVAERLVQDGLNVVRDIRVAYINWRLAHESAVIAAQSAKLRNETSRIAKARVEAGDVAELDVTAVRLDALVGESDSLRAGREVDLARQRLENAMGISLAEVLVEPKYEPQPPTIDWDVNQLASEAQTLRPDLQAIQLAVEAAQARADFARKDLFRWVGLLPDINARGTKGFEAGPGLQFSVPIFHQNQGAIARAEAEANRLRKQLQNRKNVAVLEVHLAYTQMEQSRADLAAWRDRITPQATQAVAQARKALEENGVSLLLVLETTRQLLAAQQREQQSEAQLRRAIAELERSVGRRLTNLREPGVTEIPPLPIVETEEDAS